MFYNHISNKHLARQSCQINDVSHSLKTANVCVAIVAYESNDGDIRVIYPDDKSTDEEEKQLIDSNLRFNTYDISIAIIMLNFMIKIAGIFSTDCFSNHRIKTYAMTFQRFQCTLTTQGFFGRKFFFFSCFSTRDMMEIDEEDYSETYFQHV